MSAILWTTSTHDDRRLASALRARLVRRLQETARGVSRSERARRHAAFAEAWQGLRERDRLPLLVEFFERREAATEQDLRAAGAGLLLDLLPSEQLPSEQLPSKPVGGTPHGAPEVVQVAAGGGDRRFTRPGDIR
jgi:hypothetical protein